jgi:hypothetical protein
MVVETLAATALAVVTPYIVKAGEEFAKKAGAALSEKVGAVYEAIKRKFTGDPLAEQTLARVAEKPDSEGAKSMFKELLNEKLSADPDFASTLSRLLEEAKAADTRNVLAIGERSVAIGGDNTGNITTGDQWKPSS